MGKRRKKSGRRASTKFLAAGNAWRAHVKKTMADNPNMKFGKALLKLASKTYRKPISVRNTQYSVRVRPRTRKAGKVGKKNRTRRAGRKKKSNFLGF